MSIANPLVLIADDDPDIRMLVRLRLERSGYTVIAANDGLEALELAAGSTLMSPYSTCPCRASPVSR